MELVASGNWHLVQKKKFQSGGIACFCWGCKQVSFHLEGELSIRNPPELFQNPESGLKRV